MIDWPKVVQDLEVENAWLKKDIEHKDALVAAAYRAAAVVCRNALGPEFGAAEIQALTTVDAENALRKFGLAIATEAIRSHGQAAWLMEDAELIVDEVMEKNT